MINLYSTTITDQAIDNVVNTLKSTLISAGRKAQDFEDMLSEKYGFKKECQLNTP